MKNRIVLALAALLLVLAAAGAQAQLPPGKWWRRAEIVQRLGLSEDQQTRLDNIFRGSANDLIDMKGSVEKESIALRGELDQPQLNRQAISRIAARLNDARARLFERELMMLVDMRAVLSDPQWNQMRAEVERVGPRNQQQQRKQMRNPGRNQRPD
jgi:hypothetical protein